jgi:uncharacterized membrane protein
MPRVVSWSWKAAIVLACVVYQVLVHSSVSNAQVGALHQALMELPLAAFALAASSGISHAVVYLFLLWYFGRTLAPGREPIIARFARRVYGALTPAMERFTRRLTIAWCAFFAAQLTVSALLFAFAPLSAWSLFINLLNLPLLTLMFVGQVVYRRLRHPDWPRGSVWQAVEAFSKDALPSKSAEAR